MRGWSAKSDARENTPERITKKEQYGRLDEIGYDMVAARMDSGVPEATIAGDYRVSRFNLGLWMRRQRTMLFCTEQGVDGVLDMISAGSSLGMIAEQHELSNGMLELWSKEMISPDQMNLAREAAAEVWFAKAFTEIDTADEIALSRINSKVKLQQFIVSNTTRRYSSDKNIRVQGGEGISFQISYGQKAEE